jgi:hypothetical protein
VTLRDGTAALTLELKRHKESDSKIVYKGQATLVSEDLNIKENVDLKIRKNNQKLDSYIFLSHGLEYDSLELSGNGISGNFQTGDNFVVETKHKHTSESTMIGEPSWTYLLKADKATLVVTKAE